MSSGNKAIRNTSKKRYIILGAVFYLTLLVAYAPASILSWAIEKSGIREIGLRNTSGSLWNGSGQLVSLSGKNKAYILTKLDWDISLGNLFLGKLKTYINFSDDALMGKATVALGFGSINIENLKLGLPASTISQFYKPAALMSPSGNITINSKKLELTRDSISGKAKLQWHDAGSRLSSVRPLGDYELLITSNKEGSKANIRIKTLAGALNATANGAWDIAKTGALTLNGHVTPVSNKAELEPLLRLLGRDMGGGKRALRVNTKLSL
ncbi:MAG: type II secretion system protein N [Proteobacteria bacterium]|nr:type II secretion system protein N [Pseudomonadota bacterium]